MNISRIGITIVRLRAIREDRQLTDGLREGLDGAIEELEQVVADCEGERDVGKRKRLLFRAVERIGWWLLLHNFDWPDDPDAEC